ncbi:hypothetical protein CYMTET_46990 [Cymbomonas tetramitiformis]|uniref:Uncharacterized protein n=1 Tax=Cymbomonas tetramitiformis TaxID=36881 RepID=A0AAE0EX14_9CHLO|nr:hypothetical protein CYMTET_46990 [Cymbomonas tetramitiformis]
MVDEARQSAVELAASITTPQPQGKLATWDSFKRNLVQDPLVYTRELGQLRQTAEPSRLQLLVKRGRNRLSQVITPHLSSNGMQFKDLFLDANTRSIQPITGPSILLTLTKAKEVPEIGNHQIHYRRVRLCLFDGVKFVGNVQVANVPPPLANRPYKWIMDQESSTFYVRSQERRKSLPLQLKGSAGKNCRELEVPLLQLYPSAKVASFSAPSALAETTAHSDPPSVSV